MARRRHENGLKYQQRIESEQLRKVAPKQQLLLSGNEKAISQITLPAKTATIMSLHDLEHWL